MGWRAYLGGAIGFIVGTFIAQLFLRGAPENSVLLTMQTVCAFTGALGGLLSGVAWTAGNRSRAVLAALGGVAACFLVGLAIWVYRWIIS